MRPQSPIDPPLASISMFSSLVCQGKRLLCVYVCVCISPSSLLSLSPHIQMSLHLSCKCLFGCDKCMCVCMCLHALFFSFYCVLVLLFILVLCKWSTWALLCACGTRCGPASLLSQRCLNRSSESRRLALVSISGRSSKSGKRKTTRACQSRTNSPLTHRVSPLQQFKEWGEKWNGRGKAGGFFRTYIKKHIFYHGGARVRV